MTFAKWTTALAVMGISSALYAAESNDVIVSHYEQLQRLSVTTGATDTSQKIGKAAPVTLSFDALGRTFDLRLEPNNRLLSASSRSALPENLKIYRGRLAGNSASWVRIVSLNGIPSGLIWDGTQMFAVEAPGDSILPISEPIIYRLADTFIVPGTMSCGDTPLVTNGAANFKNLVSELSAAKAQAPGAMSEIELGAIGDYEFTNNMGSGADAAIVARLNNVDGIFSEQLGIQITVRVLETFSDPADPFTDTTVSGTLLDELSLYRESSPAQNALGLTHLYTGRDLDTTTVGIAFSGALCWTRYGAGLSEGNRGTTTDSLIAAHEIGHNFGAPHDGQTGSACEAETDPFIMSPSINGSDQFSACSISQMQDDIAVASCIVPLPSVDMGVSLNGQIPTPLLGNSVTLTFDVTNNGTTQASNVVTDVTLPNNVSFISAAASAGSCSAGAGTVNCALGDVPGSSARTVTITSATTASGAGVFNATVSADVDDNLSNNQFAAQVTVDPAVDLVANTPATATITIDQSTTVRTVIENRSILGATAVTLGISLDSGLRADSATWSAGTCTVAAQQIDCTASSLGAQSSSTLDIGVTGMTVGTKTYTATLSANEVDANTNNNSVTGTVTVNSVDGSSGDDESGAGATGPVILWLLLCAAILRHRRRFLS